MCALVRVSLVCPYACVYVLWSQMCVCPPLQILRPLRHENIILMLDAFETPRDFCVVTEFAQGELFRVLEVRMP